MPAEYRQPRFAAGPDDTEILLVRHGESAAAVPGQPFDLVEGQGDPPLHAEGREQARKVADRLAGEPITAIYVTSLRRTSETAAPLAARLGLSPVTEPDLREVHLGEWEGGAFRRHVAEGHPVAQRMLEQERWDAIPGAEPAEVFAARTGDALRRVAAVHRGQLVAVFTHGGVIGSLLAQASGSRPFAFNRADNGSISHLVVTPRSWVIRCFNDTGHLARRFGAAPSPPT